MTYPALGSGLIIDHTERGIRFDTRPEAMAAGRDVIWLAMTQSIALSMTQRQLDVFLQMIVLQMMDAGPHSLLPNVTAELLALARRPWWDRGVADLPDEREKGSE